MRWPLRRQILLPMAGILLVTVGAVSALNAWLATRRVERQLEVQLADVARTLAGSNFPLEANVLRQTRGLTGAEFVVQTQGGDSLAASDEALLSAAGSDAVEASSQFHWDRTVTAAGQQYFHAIVLLDRRAVGGERLRLHVFYPVAAWREARWQAAWPPLAIGLAAVALVAAAAYALALHVTRPIGELRRQVERIAGGEFRAVPPPARDDEIRDLAAAVNQMAQRLARYQTETRQSERMRTLATLGAGIAHQIRNAATGCRIALDLHQRDCHAVSAGSEETLAGVRASSGSSQVPPGRRDLRANGQALAVAIRQLGQIETYIQRFLALGRPATPMSEEIDLSDIVEQAIELAGPQAEHLGVAIEFQRPPQPAIARGDGPALVQMVVNLLVNAVEATASQVAGTLRVPSDGARTVPAAFEESVLVRLKPRGETVELSIGDTGPGPSAAIAARLFEPFATDKPGGTGLGLVVARQVAEDHGGTIRWQRDDSRTWFIVELSNGQRPGHKEREKP